MYVKIRANQRTSSFEELIRPSDELYRYYFRTCVDEEKDKMRETYLEILKTSSVKGLCNKYPDLCKKENVEVQCKE